MTDMKRIHTAAEIAEFRRDVNVGDTVQVFKAGLSERQTRMSLSQFLADDQLEAAVTKFMTENGSQMQLRDVMSATESRLTLDDGSVWSRREGTSTAHGERSELAGGRIYPPDHDEAAQLALTEKLHVLERVASFARGGESIDPGLAEEAHDLIDELAGV